VIPNVTRGGKTHGVLLYLVGKGKREEHENPHLVAGSPEAIRIGEASSRGRQLGDRGEHPERSTRQTLERIVRACATAGGGETEFIQRMRDEGIRLRPRYAEGGTDEVVGYSVRLPDADQGSRRTVWYGGGRLARDLTLPALRRGWRQDAAAQRRAVAVWGRSRD
jgi:hypothetical protein